ncbi:sensor domain-containing protein [Bacillus suaedaesalsae]|uniref:EAL domain-containing protein n=1 Tax=Bacillus suaedaesalsae TaxID=2810349 RepID=A0ABS2DM84_9BACI|nr:GGDEF and EAL domain-containing protein [Bacillus suaedaesalsae]MBM6619611.1 EAL domain-containing protein [Bacillus suaedaesalsae]
MTNLLSDIPSLYSAYKSLFTNNPDGCYALDTNGNCMLANERALEITGYSYDELLQSSINSIVKAQEIKKILRVFQDVLEGNKKSFEVTIIRKDGQEVELSITAMPIIINETILGVIGVAKDITESKSLQLELIQSRNQLQNIFESTNICVWSYDYRGQKLFQVSPASKRLSGYSPAEFEQEPLLWQKLIHPDDLNLYSNRFLELNNGTTLRHEYRIFHRSGEIKWISDYTVPILDADGKLERIDGVLIDITKSRNTEETLKHLSNFDLVTELPNRRMFYHSLDVALQDPSNRKLAVLYLDLDRFKYMNDSLGHHVGDQILQIIAVRLRQIVRKHDLVARLGGDEFAVLLKNVHDDAEVTEVSERILSKIRQPFELDGHEYTLTTSIGVSIYPEHAETAENLIKRADQAMYLAKEKGKNNFQIYDKSLKDDFSRKMILEQELRKALSNEQLSLHYQPIVDVMQKKIVGFEALLKWVHPTYGPISPMEFIPIAEESGIIVPIGSWVLQKACQDMKAWQTQGFEGVYVSVNVSVRQFEEVTCLERLDEILKQGKVNTNLLKIEITESLTMMDVNEMSTKLLLLEAIGIEVFLDDFGTGYSSLSYLQRLPIKVLKIDKSFIQDIESSSDQETIIETIIAMSKSLRMNVIAEGVEEEKHLQFLQNIGCTQMQGYYFSKPIPFNQLQDLSRSLKL